MRGNIKYGSIVIVVKDSESYPYGRKL